MTPIVGLVSCSASNKKGSDVATAITATVLESKKTDLANKVAEFNKGKTDELAAEINALLTVESLVTKDSTITLSANGELLNVTKTVEGKTLKFAVTINYDDGSIKATITSEKAAFVALVTDFISAPDTNKADALNTAINQTGLIRSDSTLVLNDEQNLLTITNPTEDGQTIEAKVRLTFHITTTGTTTIDSSQSDFESLITLFNNSNTDASYINTAARLPLSQDGLVVTASSRITLSDDKLTMSIENTSADGVIHTLDIALTYNVTLPAITKNLNSTKDDFKALVDTFNSTKNDDNANALNTALDLTSANDGFVVTTTSTVGLNPNKTTLTVENTVDGLTTTRTINLVYLVILDTANISSTKATFKTQVTTFTTTPSVNNANAINAAIGKNGLVIATSTVTLTSDGLTLTVTNIADDVTTTTTITLTYSIAASNTATVTLDKNAFKTKVDTYIATKNKTNADVINTAISQPGLITATSDVTLSSNGLTLTVTNIADDVTTTTTITLTYYIAHVTPSKITKTVNSSKLNFETKVTAFENNKNPTTAGDLNTALNLVLGTDGFIVTATSTVTLSPDKATLTVENTANNVTITGTIGLTYSIAASATATVSSDKNAFKTLVDTYIATKNKTNADAINTAISQPGLITATSTVTLNDTTLTVVNTANSVTTTTTITLTYNVTLSKITRTVSLSANDFIAKVTAFENNKNPTTANAINTALNLVSGTDDFIVTPTSTVTLSDNKTTLTIVNTVGGVTTTATIGLTYHIVITKTVNSSDNDFATLVNNFHDTPTNTSAASLNTALKLIFLSDGFVTRDSTITLSSNKATLIVVNIVGGVTITTTFTLTYATS